MEQQNQLLRRQLSISQNQLIQAWGTDEDKNLSFDGKDKTDASHVIQCKDKVSKDILYKSI